MKSKLLTQWKQSLEPFKKGNLKLYLLGTLATWIRSIKIIIRLFWWLLLIEWASTIFVTQSTAINSFAGLIPLILDLIFFYIAIMTLRPSIEIKNYHYYLKYKMGLLFLFILYFFNQKFFPADAFILLFFLDSDTSLLSSIKSIAQTLKVLIFFTPACMLFFVLVRLFNIILMLLPIHSLAQTTMLFACLVINTFLSLFAFSAITVYYIKMKHAHFDFLFE